MAAWWLLARTNARRQWGSTVVLTLLIAIVGAVALTTIAGARRTRSSVDRLAAATRLPTMFIGIQGSFAEARDVAALPPVADAALGANVIMFSPSGYQPALAAVDSRLGNRLRRDRLLRGRRPAPGEAHEITLSEPLAARYGVDVGGHIDMYSPSIAQARCLNGLDDKNSPSCRDMFANGDVVFDRLAGPRFAVTVVGITRGVHDLTARPDDLQVMQLSQAFYDRYRGKMFMQPGVVVRLRPAATVEQMEAAVARRLGAGAIFDQGNTETVLVTLRNAVGALANGLLVVAVATTMVGLAAIVLVIWRALASGTDERAVLRDLGVTRRGAAADAATVALPAVLIGPMLAVGIAALGSAAMPIGVARRAEPRPGMDVDAGVLVGGGTMLLVAGLVAITITAVAAAYRRGAATRARASRLPAWPSVTATVGTRFALAAGPTSRRTSARVAIAGVAIGVMGIVGALVFNDSLTSFTADPQRFGYGWDTTVSSQRYDAIARVPGVDGVTEVWLGYQAPVDGRTTTAFAQRAVYGAGSSFSIIDGRAVRTTDEAVLGRLTLRRLHKSIGDEVMVKGRPMTVVGTAVFPTSDDGYPLADGLLLAPEALESLHLDQDSTTGFRTTAVRLAPGTDRAAAMRALIALNEGDGSYGLRRPPEVDELRQVRHLPRALVVMLLLVAIVGLGNTLRQTLRVRRGDIAIVRVLGCTPRQARSIVRYQASTIVLVGAALGIPLGILAGRAVWSTVANGLGISPQVEWPVTALLVTLTVAFALGLLASWYPGRRAGRLQPAEVLRSE